MDIDARLYVEIEPFDGPYPPHPHPIDEAHFDPAFVYKVLGMYNPSETSECYFVLANPRRQIWFIPQRHLLAYKLIDCDEFFIKKDDPRVTAESRTTVAGETTTLTAPPPLAPALPPGSVTSKLARGRISGAEVHVRLSDPDSPQRYGKGF